MGVITSYSIHYTKLYEFVGEVLERTPNGMAKIAVKNKFMLGNNLELMTPQGNISFALSHLENKKGEQIEVAPGDGHVVQIPVPEDIDLNYGILLRNLNDAETTRQPHAVA